PVDMVDDCGEVASPAPWTLAQRGPRVRLGGRVERRPAGPQQRGLPVEFGGAQPLRVCLRVRPGGPEVRDRPTSKSLDDLERRGRLEAEPRPRDGGFVALAI